MSGVKSLWASVKGDPVCIGAAGSASFAHHCAGAPGPHPHGEPAV